MTRINAGIPPAELSDKHLLAEHREIKRIPNTIKSGKADLSKPIPKEFTLGKGHVRFFYDKLKYLEYRYRDIFEECKKRGFNVTNYIDAFYLGGSWNHLILSHWNDWKPTPEAIELIKQRIKERTK